MPPLPTSALPLKWFVDGQWLCQEFKVAVSCPGCGETGGDTWDPPKGCLNNVRGAKVTFVEKHFGQVHWFTCSEHPYLFVCFVELGIEPKALHMLGKCSKPFILKNFISGKKLVYVTALCILSNKLQNLLQTSRCAVGEEGVLSPCQVQIGSWVCCCDCVLGLW
jgi:hypothetical protein